MNQISAGITREIMVVLLFVLAGSLLIFVYDILRIIRRLVHHSKWVIAVQDILYWIGCAIFIFVMLCKENEGSVRGYVMGGILIGMLLYNHFISPFVIRYAVMVIRFCVGLIRKPFCFLGRLLLRQGRFMSKYRKRVCRRIRMVLKKMRKTIKMALCKL